MSFEAKHPGVCGFCGEFFPAGTELRANEDDGWVHSPTCPEPVDDDEPQRNERKCPDCFTIHAGECL